VPGEPECARQGSQRIGVVVDNQNVGQIRG
jgi:hypothetical protein